MSVLTDLGHWLSNGVLRATKLALGPFSYSRRLAIGGWIGRNLLVRLPMARKRFDRNVSLVYPEISAAERAAFLRKVGDNTGRTLVEEMMMDRFMADGARFRPVGPGWARYLACHAEGRGAIIASAHFGNWEGMRAASRLHHGIPIAGVYRPHNNPYYNADFEASLAHISPDAFPKGRQGTRDLIRHLRKGGVAAILVDQKQSGSPLIPFLGHPAETTLTAAKLAKSQKIDLIPTLTYRAADGETFDCWVGETIAHGDEEQMMRAVNDVLSAKIAERPEQWFWFHRRWR